MRLDKNIISSILIIFAILSISPMFEVWIQGNFLFVFCIALTVLLNIDTIKLSSGQISCAASIFVISTLLTLYWYDIKLFLYPIYFILAGLAVSVLNVREMIFIVRFLSYFLIVICIGAVIGFIYAFIGGDAIFTFNNPDGRPNYFFLTTLSNAVYGNVIRPSGIFDEPGTLSFYICFIAAARHVLKLPKRITWFLLISGLITFSVAHVIYIVFHLISEKLYSRYFLRSVAFFSVFVIGLSFNSGVVEVADNMLFSRFTVVDGQFSGDNRSDLMMNAFSHLDMSTFVFGLDSSCVTDYENCKQKYGMIGENILGPLVQAGFFLSLPYYTIISLILLIGLKKKFNFVYIGLALLLMQRPYVMSYGYSLLIYFVFNLDRYYVKNARSLSDGVLLKKTTRVVHC